MSSVGALMSDADAAVIGTVLDSRRMADCRRHCPAAVARLGIGRALRAWQRCPVLEELFLGHLHLDVRSGLHLAKPARRLVSLIFPRTAGGAGAH